MNGNNLAGTIPASIGNLSALTSLSLNVNQLTGGIPASLGNLSNLKVMSLHTNQLTGDIPASLGNLSYLTSLNLSINQLSGVIPSSIGDLSNLNTIHISHNQLTGPIPPSLGKLSKLDWINLSNNQLSGNFHDSLCNLSALFIIELDNNQLSGSIPDSIVKLSKLRRLRLFNNQLSGHIPDSLGNISNLFDISLNRNRLSGGLPSSLKKLINLNTFTIQDNEFTFTAMENLPLTLSPPVYSPQAAITLNRTGNLFSVSAGGTLANDTFRLYKNGVLNTTKTGDSTFIITAPGQYYVTVNNNVATKLTLFTDPYTIAGLRLADSTATVIQTITGVTPVDIEDTPYHKLLLTVTPAPGVNALSGDVTFKIIIDPAVTSFNNQPYVQRHYDVTPAGNAANAQATVKLYFTQQDFDNFNASPAHGLDLPSGPADVAGIANLRVYQYHGFSTTSLPGSYSGAAVEINPDDANIVWNASAQYWEVSFEVNGFSGFFVSSVNTALLPVRLVSFTGKIQHATGLLQWVTTKEINTSYFELQRSINGSNFNSIANIAAAGNSNNNLSYQYSDLQVTEPVYYYRLKMVDRDGLFSYSNVIKLVYVNDNDIFSIYPNPAKDFVFVRIPSAPNATKLTITDMAGRIIRTISVPGRLLQIKLQVKGLPHGIYKIACDGGVKAFEKTLMIE